MQGSRAGGPRILGPRLLELPFLPSHQIQATIVKPGSPLDSLHCLRDHKASQAGGATAVEVGRVLSAWDEQAVSAIIADLNVLHPRGDANAKPVRLVGQQVLKALWTVEADGQAGKQGNHLKVCAATHGEEMQPIEPRDILELEHL